MGRPTGKGEHCPRCKERKDFSGYCDVGMKAVLRKLKGFLLRKMDLKNAARSNELELHQF